MLLNIIAVLKQLKSSDSYKAEKQGNWELQISMALNTELLQLMRLLGAISFASASKEKKLFLTSDSTMRMWPCTQSTKKINFVTVFSIATMTQMSMQFW